MKIIRKTAFFILLFSISITLFSQKTKMDSLLNIIQRKAIDTNTAKCGYKLSSLYMEKGMVDSGFKYSKKSYALSKQLKFTRGLAVNSNIFGQVYKYQGNLDSAVFYFTQAKQYYTILKDTARVAGMFNNLGVVYKSHGNISKALDCYFLSLKIKEQQKDTGGIANAYSNIGHLYDDLNDTANVIKYHLKALDLRKRINDTWGISNSVMAIGLYHQSNNRLAQALPYLIEALKLSENLGDEESISIACYNLANVYYKQHKIDECLTLYKRALDISIKNNNKEGIATCLEIIGQISLEKKDTKAAIKNLEEAYTTAQEIGFTALIQSISEKLSEAYNSTGDYKKAYSFYKISSEIKDSLFSQENIRKMTSEGIKYENEKEKIILEKEQEKKATIAKSESFKKDLILIASVIFLIFVTIFSFILFSRLKENRKQKSIIEQQRNEMIDSINYAKRIQFTLLANQDLLNTNLPEHFIFFNPKDIVSGDFYWATKKDNQFYIAICDSTGHGVPGAFMSLLNTSFLNEAINEKNIAAPNEVFNHVRDRLIENMEGAKDGMDGILMKFHYSPSDTELSLKEVHYAAANNALIVIRNSEIIQFPKDKMPVGKGENTESFSLHTITLQKGDVLFAFTDGYADQFGGTKNKKFMNKQLTHLLLANHHLPMEEQRNLLSKTFLEWKGNNEQVDDILVFGMRI